MSTEADGAAQNVKVKVNRIRIRQKGIPSWIEAEWKSSKAQVMRNCRDFSQLLWFRYGMIFWKKNGSNALQRFDAFVRLIIQTR